MGTRSARFANSRSSCTDTRLGGLRNQEHDSDKPDPLAFKNGIPDGYTECPAYRTLTRVQITDGRLCVQVQPITME